jgi:hypothetical protein
VRSCRYREVLGSIMLRWLFGRGIPISPPSRRNCSGFLLGDATRSSLKIQSVTSLCRGCSLAHDKEVAFVECLLSENSAKGALVAPMPTFVPRVAIRYSANGNLTLLRENCHIRCVQTWPDTVEVLRFYVKAN